MTLDLALWSDPEAYYDGPVDADLSDLDPRDTVAFWAEAESNSATVRAAMRPRWTEYRGKVPPDLARIIIDDIEARGATCSKP
jgi:hypothetical protein|nr:MAG TPA_asm: hypothetical protein [Caudoviricetes sp.]